MSGPVDLSLLSKPNVIEPLDFETLFQERKDALIALYDADEQAAIAATLELESEPLVKLLQENAYRELILRQRVNEAATAVMLAYATGSDLDQIGANYNVARLLVDAGDPDAVPPVEPTYESDAEFRARIQLSPEGYTTAGSAGSYKFHALSSDAQVLDAQAVSPSPGEVTVYVLARSGNGTAGPALLEVVGDALSADTIRPMTDQVTVQSVTVTEYTVDAALTVYPGPDAEVIRQSAIDAVTKYVEAMHRIGYDITLSGLYSALHQPGVQNVVLNSPAASIVMGNGEAPYCTSVVVAVSGEDI